MAECTDLERKFLDAIGKGKSSDVYELRVQMRIAEVTPETRERIVTARVAVLLAHRELDEAWKQAPDGVHGRSLAYGEWYTAIEREAEERAKKAVAP